MHSGHERSDPVLHVDRYRRARDHVGYGENPPPGRWPGTGARVAISLVINIEDGAERSRSRGDDTDDIHSHWITDVPHVRGNPSLDSGFDYGARTGIWRVLRVTDAAQVPITAFACGRALELNPSIGEGLERRGIEVVDHGLYWEPHGNLALPALQQRMEESANIIMTMTGSAPTSWYSKDGHSVASFQLMDNYDFVHDSNCFNEDMAYLPDGLAGLVTVPYSGDTNDAQLLSTMATKRQYLGQLVAALESLLEDDRPGAKVLSVGLHPRWIGRPAYAGALKEFIARAQAMPSVVFAERRQIAAWWKSMSLEQ